MTPEKQKEFEDLFEYEICENPDHPAIYGGLVSGDVQRLGCPLCGFDSQHRILSTAKPKSLDKLQDWIEAYKNEEVRKEINSLLEEVDEWLDEDKNELLRNFKSIIENHKLNS